MGNPASSLSVEQLLAHSGWVRQLALQLVAGDRNRADDVEQETWISALRRPPRVGTDLRAWFAAVARNAARQLGRGERRRQRREQAAASEEALPSTAELAERASVQRFLVGELLTLPEPYRRVLLLRFFEERSAAQIAQHCGEPASTVRTRVQRGLELLRERLDRRSVGGREQWLAAFGLLLRPSEILVPAAAGGVLMTVKSKWVLGGAAAALLSVALWQALPESAAIEPVTMPQPQAGPVASAMSTDGAVADDPAAVARSRDIETSAPVAQRRVVLRMLDPAGAPVPGVILRTLGEEHRTDGAGRVELAIASELDPETLEVSPDESRSLLARWWRPDPGEYLVIAARRVQVAGWVSDAQGNPMPGLVVSANAPVNAMRDFPFAIPDRAAQRRDSVRTDAQGRFAFEDLPAGVGELFVRVEDRRHASAPVPEHDDDQVHLQLPESGVGSDCVLSGVVLGPEGDPVSGAEVRLGPANAVHTDASGHFRMVLHPAAPPLYFLGQGQTDRLAHTALTAVAQGMEPVVHEGFASRLVDRPQGEQNLVLQLPGPARTISGRLLGREDQVVSGWQVVLLDPSDPDMLYSAEQRSAGQKGGVRTDAEGAFEVGGLRQRSYRLALRDPVTSLEVRSGPVQAGTRELELRLPPEPFRTPVHGVVLHLDGSPAVGMEVGVTLADGELFGGRLVGGFPSATVRTDDQGCFELSRVPRDRRLLVAQGTGYETLLAEIPADGEPVELRLGRLCRFRVEGRADDLGDRLEVHDAAGRPMQITEHFEGGGIFAHTTIQVRDGRYQVCEVGERAARLVLFRGDVEIGRLDLVLDPERMQVLRP